MQFYTFQKVIDNLHALRVKADSFTTCNTNANYPHLFK